MCGWSQQIPVADNNTAAVAAAAANTGMQSDPNHATSTGLDNVFFILLKFRLYMRLTYI